MSEGGPQGCLSPSTQGQPSLGLPLQEASSPRSVQESLAAGWILHVPHLPAAHVSTPAPQFPRKVTSGSSVHRRVAPVTQAAGAPAPPAAPDPVPPATAAAPLPPAPVMIDRTSTGAASATAEAPVPPVPAETAAPPLPVWAASSGPERAPVPVAPFEPGASGAPASSGRA